MTPPTPIIGSSGNSSFIFFNKDVDLSIKGLPDKPPWMSLYFEFLSISRFIVVFDIIKPVNLEFFVYSAVLLITSNDSSGDILIKIGLIKFFSITLCSMESIRFLMCLSSWRFLNPGVLGEEAIEIGIEEIIFITSPAKYSIKKHFDFNQEIDNKLKNAGKKNLAELANPNIFHGIDFKYVNQDEQKGLGHAILLAKDYIQDEPFAILLPDDLFFSEISCLSQL